MPQSTPKTSGKAPRIDAEHMRMFVAIGRSHTLTEAAASLELPLFTVSRALKRLETMAKVELVRRDGSGLVLTGAGRDYLNACLRVLDAHRNIDEALERHRKTPEGTLRIGTPIPFAVHVLSSILPLFQRRYPGLRVDLDLYCTDWEKPPSAAQDIVIKVRSPRDSRHHMTVFPSVRQGLFASSEYLHAHSAPTRPSDLETHICVGLTRTPGLSNWNITRGTEEFSLNPHYSVVAPDMEIMTQLALRSVGLAMLPLWRAHAEVQAGRLVHVMPDWTSQEVKFCALHGGRARLASREKAFLQYLTEVLGTSADPRCQGQNPNRFFVPRSRQN